MIYPNTNTIFFLFSLSSSLLNDLLVLLSSNKLVISLMKSSIISGITSVLSLVTIIINLLNNSIYSLK